MCASHSFLYKSSQHDMLSPTERCHQTAVHMSADLVGAQAHLERALAAGLRRHEAAVHASVEPGVMAGGQVGDHRRERRRVPPRSLRAHSAGWRLAPEP